MLLFEIWYIWTNRNNNLYNNTTNKAYIYYPYKLAIEHKFLTEKESMLQGIPISVKWIKPIANHIKLNIDGSFNNVISTCGFRDLFRNSNGIWVLGFQGSSYGLSPLHAVLMALRKGLQLARE